MSKKKQPTQEQLNQDAATEAEPRDLEDMPAELAATLPAEVPAVPVAEEAKMPVLATGEPSADGATPFVAPTEVPHQGPVRAQPTAGGGR